MNRRQYISAREKPITIQFEKFAKQLSRNSRVATIFVTAGKILYSHAYVFQCCYFTRSRMGFMLNFCSWHFY